MVTLYPSNLDEVGFTRRGLGGSGSSSDVTMAQNLKWLQGRDCCHQELRAGGCPPVGPTLGLTFLTDRVECRKLAKKAASAAERSSETSRSSKHLDHQPLRQRLLGSSEHLGHQPLRRNLLGSPKHLDHHHYDDVVWDLPNTWIINL